MRHPHFLAACLLLASVPSSGCRNPTAEVESDQAAAATHQRVEAGTPTRKVLTLYSTQPCRIEAYESTPLYAKIAGYVEEVTVDIGDVVKDGDILVRLSVPEITDDLEQSEALVAQAEAEIKQSEAAVAAAKAEVQTAEAKREQALSGIDAAGAELARWESEYKRISELAANGSVTSRLAEESKSHYGAAEANWKQAHATVTAATAAVTQAKVNVTKAEADVEAAMARLRVAKANLDRVKTMRNYTEIRSPFDGVVTRREVDTGHFVQPSSSNASPLLTVSRMDRVRIFVDIPEYEASMVQGGPEGDSAVIRVPALGDKELSAQVTRTAWSLEASNRSLRTEFEVANDEGMLRPGMYATARILLDQRDNALAVPATAIVRQGDTSYVCRVDNGLIRRQAVQLGMRSGEDVEIVSGIQDSDVIVLTHAELLQDGQPVEVASAETK